jgi:hypothetical protein
MLGVTLFGIFLTPVFYYVIRWYIERNLPQGQASPPASASGLDQATPALEASPG